MMSANHWMHSATMERFCERGTECEMTISDSADNILLLLIFYKHSHGFSSLLYVWVCFSIIPMCSISVRFLPNVVA